MFNSQIIHDHHDIDALLSAAKIHPTENIIQGLIDKKIDPNGNYCEPQFCAFLWRKAVHINSTDTALAIQN